jgi:acetoin:2,6-dichlorophenolindophenol oxidoreductase subunit beta
MSKSTNFREALNEAMAEEMRRDPSVVVIGEDVRISLLGQTAGLMNEFGKDRVINTPVAENVIAGAAIGAAMNGLRPILELIMCDFSLLAMEELYNQLGQLHYASGGQYSLPVTVRTTVGGGMGMGYGHSQCLESQFVQAPGLIVVEPSTVYDAKGLLKSAIRSDDPVIFFEHKKLLWGNVTEELPEEEYTIPFGKAMVRRAGKDITVVAFGFMVYEALDAAQELSEEGIEAEVIDPRTIVPLDKVAILNSVEKTGRLVIVEEGRKRGGLGAEIAALVSEESFAVLKAPIRRIAAPNIPVPGSRVLEDLYLPNKKSIVSALRSLFR